MNPITQDDAVAVMRYVDGEMPESERPVFEARLAADPALAQAVAGEKTLRSRLDVHYAPVLDEPIPAGLHDLLSVADEIDSGGAANDPLPQPGRHGATPGGAAAARPGAVVTSIGLARGRRDTAGASGDTDAAANTARGRRAWGWQEWGGMAASVLLGVVLGARALAPFASSSPSAPQARDSAAPPAGATTDTATGTATNALANAGTATGTGGAADTHTALAVDATGGLSAQGRLRDALEQRVAGAQAGQDGVAIGLSFQDRSRQYCRTFSLAGADASPGAAPGSQGIACKEDGQWRVANLERAPAAATVAAAELAGASSPVVSTGAEGLGYRTAASAFSPTLLQAIDALRAGDTLDGAAEAAAKARGWRP